MKVIKAYQFFELSEKVKAKVIDNQRYINVEFEDWFDDCKIDYENLLTNLGFYDFDLRFSGFYSQGGGASFTGKWSYDLARPYKVDRYWRRFLTNLSKYKGATATIKLRDWQNYNQSSCYIGTDCQCMDFLKDLENLRLAICDAYYESLKADYEYYVSDDAVADTLDNCDWLLYTNMGVCIND